MAAYFTGGGGGTDVVQAAGTDGLQTLYLMNPSYVGFTDAAPAPSGGAAANMVFLNSAVSTLTPASFGHHQPTQAAQHFVGIPLQPAPQSGYNQWGPDTTAATGNDVSPRHGQKKAPAAGTSAAELSPVLSLSSREAPPPVTVAAAVPGGNQEQAVMRSRYLKAAQELLDEAVSASKGVEEAKGSTAVKKKEDSEGGVSGGGGGGAEDGGGSKSGGGAEMSTAERQELQMKKSKLLNMLDEVEQRYRQYHRQMQAVAAAFEAVKTSINGLNAKMDGILQKGSELGLLPINHEILNEGSEFSSEVVPDDYTVGDIENEANKLIDILTDRKSARTLVAIVGGNGTGKTTLAWKIHDDHRTRNAFGMILWVSVFNDFDDIGLLSAIVTAAGGNPKEAKNRMQLELMLASMLKGKRFLLVLDDVRSHQIEENSLEAHWHVYGHGSRILITTRDENVATKVNASYIHRVKELTFQNCWSLLCHNACLDENLHGNTLRNVGIMITQKCNKIPMAVKIIGAVLRRKEQTQEAWERVYEFEGCWSFNDLPGDVHGLTGAIYLGYHDLPSHLKQCLVYLSLLPEGSTIRQQFVSQLWISEGLIDQRDNCSAEKIAEEYYEELISRNLLHLEIGHRDITRCIMHDQIRSFLQFFAKDKIFSGELKSSTNGASSEGLRHVWITGNSPTTNLGEIATVTNLKTIILYKNPLGNQGLGKLFKGLKYLHVLDLGGTEIRYIPRTLEFLIHLRLLNLSLTRITELPESIKYLRNLQFLGLRYCNWLHTLPKGIGNLYKLQTLDLRGTSLHQVLPSLVNLKQLSMLHGFTVNRTPIPEDDPSGWPLEHLKDLNALRSLQILKMEKVSDFSRVKEAMLEMKSQLKDLEICCSNDDRLAKAREDDARTVKQIFDSLSPPQCLKSLKIVSYYSKHFPNWLPRLINLQRLVLSDCKFCEHMPDLSQLNQLKFLTIIGCSKLLTMEQERTGVTQAFPKLEQLHLKDMPKLLSWTGFASDDKPSLVKFRLESCPKLKYLPDGLKYSRVLRSVQLRHADSLEVIQELPVLKELDVQACNELKKVSNLPLLEVLTIRRCPSLEDVTGVHYLSHVRIIDKELRKLPDWLSIHAPVLQTFNIVGVSELLDRLLPNGEDWEIIRHIDKVYANLLDESPFFTYTKSSGDFHVDQRIGEINKPPVMLVPGIAHGGPSIPDYSVETSSQIGVARVPVNRISTVRRVIRSYLVLYLSMVMVVMQFLSYYLHNRSTREIWLVQTLFIFFATVFLLLLVFVD